MTLLNSLVVSPRPTDLGILVGTIGSIWEEGIRARSTPRIRKDLLPWRTAWEQQIQRAHPFDRKQPSIPAILERCSKQLAKSSPRPEPRNSDRPYTSTAVDGTGCWGNPKIVKQAKF